MVVPPDLLDTETSKLAEQIAFKSNFGIRLGKDVFYKQLKCDCLEQAYDYATEKIVCNFQYEDEMRGIGNFVEIRKSIKL